jgi:predicted NAD/FAD-binding protein
MGRIAVIGGGAAGLVTAWLLEPVHDVTLFEADPRLGGHARTLTIELGGRERTVDVGAHFLSERMHPRLLALLRHLAVPLCAYPPSATFLDRRDGWTVCLPPHGGLGRMAGLTELRCVRALLALRTLIRAATPLVEERDDFATTLEELVEPLAIPESMRREFVYPYLSSYWGVSADEVRTYSARNVTSYLVTMRPPVITPRPLLRIVGGIEAYVRRLVASFTRAELRCGAAVRGLVEDGDHHAIALDDRRVAGFDHVVFAGSAERTRALLSDHRPSRELCGVLGRFEYYDAALAVHGDRSFMPPRRSQWSVVNSVFDGRVGAITNWEHGNHDVDLFRSWTHDGREPKSLHATYVFRHPRPNAAYFACQRSLERHQGVGGLWHAGMHVKGFDHHDSAIASAVQVATALAPDSPRLGLL